MEAKEGKGDVQPANVTAPAEAKKEKKRPSPEYDIFVANSKFPDPLAVFAHMPSLSNVRESAFVVIDTNVLLVPYAIRRESLDQIRHTYEKLAKEKRLCVPGQTVREFASNRNAKLGEVFQQLKRRIDGFPQLVSASPFLSALPEYVELIALETSVRDYKKALQKTIDRLSAWEWDDPVSQLYRDVIGNDVVWDLPLDSPQRIEIEKELHRRAVHHIPPGYKDGAKEDCGIGDLLIWKTILAIGAAKKQHLIFVSGEEKSDWRYGSEKQPLLPRYELVDEYRRESGGHSFHMINFSQFLELFDAAADIVKEVREKESTGDKESTNSVAATCQTCRTTFMEQPDNRRPCPRCGGMSRHFSVSIAEAVGPSGPHPSQVQAVAAPTWQASGSWGEPAPSVRVVQDGDKVSLVFNPNEDCGGTGHTPGSGRRNGRFFELLCAKCGRVMWRDMDPDVE